MAPVIGIDLGTTSSRVAIFEKRNPVILENSEGQGTTPSYIAVTPDGDRLVGEAARRYAVHDPKNVAFAVKRIIGRKYIDPIVQEIRQYVPFSIVEAVNGDAWVRLSGQDFSPVQLSAFVLQKMKQTAESYLSVPVSQAVITVPAYFSDAQRQATRDAATIAGLDVLRIICEPTAAALAYGLDRKKDLATIVVYDIGGGTFDVSILEIGDGVFEVKSTRGDMHLGGEDIDYRIVRYIADQFKDAHGVDLLVNDVCLQRLKHAAEQAKIELSSQMAVAIDVPFAAFKNGLPLHLHTTITRGTFERLVQDLVKRTIAVCADALRGANCDGADLTSLDIDQIVLVGGSTRIPAINSALEKFFCKKPFGGLRREDAVALGAAIQAGVLRGKVKDVLLLDVVPLPLGVETQGGQFAEIIRRNVTIPTKRAQLFSVSGKFPDTHLIDLGPMRARHTAEGLKWEHDDLKNPPSPYLDTRGATLVRVLQGESQKAFENVTLGRFVIDGIPTAADGKPRIQLLFDVDANGLLHVSAQDVSTGREESICVQASSGVAGSQLEEMAIDAKLRPVGKCEMRPRAPFGQDWTPPRREVAEEPPPVAVAERRRVDEPSSDKPAIFVSYAHEDAKWARSIERALAILTNKKRIELFIDNHIRTGEEWKRRIFRSIETSSAAILLLSSDFFCSTFIMSEELPVIMAENKRRGLSLIPIVVRPCPFELNDDVAQFQAFNNPEKPLSSLSAWQVDGEFSRLAREIAKGR